MHTAEKGDGVMALFQTGDHVIYKNNGVCRIEDIRPLAFGEAEKDYYVLRPIGTEGTVYVPTEREDEAPKLKKIPTKEEIDALLLQVEKSDLKWIENSKMRIVAFDRMLSSSDRASILWVLKMLSLRQKEESSRGKRLCANEERILTTAKKIIVEEFAYALELEPKQVIPYILKKIGKEA